MRGIFFLLVFVSSLPFIFISPFNGVLIWNVFSLGNFHTLTWGYLGDLYYAYIIAILTCLSWAFSRTEKKQLPLTPLVVLTLLFSVWMTITSYCALAPSQDVWDKWIIVHKILFMCLVGFALTTTRERLQSLIWAVVLSVGFWGVKGAVSVILHGGAGGVGIHGPEGGITAANNEFGVALVMLLPLVFYLWQIAENRHVRRGVMIMGILITLATIFTYSRGGMIGLCAMGAMFWLRSRAKLAAGLVILLVCLLTYAFVPQDWFDRMATIQHYEAEGSATGRIYYWQIALRIAELHPFVGGGFRVTFWPTATNPMLLGTALPLLKAGRAVHSIYMDALSEHGWIGLGLFLVIAAYAWFTCSWLIRNSRDRPDLIWANLLGRMGHAVLVGYWVAGAFSSLAYFDQYWGCLFIFEAARRIVAKEIVAPAGAVATVPARRPRVPQLGIPARVLGKSDDRPGYVKGSP